MTLINADIFERIVEKKKRLDNIRPISQTALKRLEKRFAIEWTYNSNAIEGNTLTLNETKIVLERGLTVKGKPLREHFETINHRDAINYIDKTIQNKEKITQNLIKKIHSIILKNINEEDAGSYRAMRVRILGAVFTPPEPFKINNLMNELVMWLNDSKLHPIELCALFHHKLVHIHPFSDGNGRTARLIMNLILMRFGYPPAIILNVDRKKYYDCLKKADLDDFIPFVNFIARSVERSIDLYIESLEPVTSKNKGGLIPLLEASKDTSYSQEYLSLLARKGRIGAVKVQRNWLISKDEINAYVTKMKLKKKRK